MVSRSAGLRHPLPTRRLSIERAEAESMAIPLSSTPVNDPAQNPAPRLAAPGLLRQFWAEIEDYVRDYGRLALAEAGEKANQARQIAMKLGLALLLGLFGFFFLTVALVALINAGIHSWGWSSLIVGVIYGIIAMGLLFSALRGLRAGLLSFPRLRQRFQQDKAWRKDSLAA